MHTCLHLRHFRHPVKFLLHLRRSVSHQKQLAAMHLDESVKQRLDALTVHKPPHKQDSHRLRIPLYLPQDGLPLNAPVGCHVNAVGNDTALLPKLRQNRGTGDVPLRCHNDAVHTAQKAQQ